MDGVGLFQGITDAFIAFFSIFNGTTFYWIGKVITIAFLSLVVIFIAIIAFFTFISELVND